MKGNSLIIPSRTDYIPWMPEKSFLESLGIHKNSYHKYERYIQICQSISFISVTENSVKVGNHLDHCCFYKRGIFKIEFGFTANCSTSVDVGPTHPTLSGNLEFIALYISPNRKIRCLVHFYNLYGAVSFSGSKKLVSRKRTWVHKLI